MNNKNIIKLIKKAAQLMELVGENDFKIRSYQNAVFALERFDGQLANLSIDQLEKIDGIGKSIAAAIDEINRESGFSTLEKLLENIPAGVVEMLNISGVGPKKIRLLWQELQIEDLQSLKEACEKGLVSNLKGFGKKTEENILESVNYLLANKGKLHYAVAVDLAQQLKEQLLSLGNQLTEIVGEVRRKLEVIQQIELLTTLDFDELENWLTQHPQLIYDPATSGPFSLKAIEQESGMPITFYLSDEDEFAKDLLAKSAAPEHLSYEYTDGKSILQLVQSSESFESETAIYQRAGLPYIIPELRENRIEWELAGQNAKIELIEDADLKGILHNHSTYSDGVNSLREMAVYCKELGYAYLGISDHSKSAQYAGGLFENQIKEQWTEIEQLNKELAPFKIFKGIESDILADGSLDYAADTLAGFDFIVASIHSGLKMDKQKATDRLLRAIANPFTTMLGHPTGRLLLRREAYPIDHKKIIDACAHYGVIIEINANPWRLDLDWRWVNYAITQGVLISINPDAHETNGYHDMHYGVCVGRKGGLTKEMTFNAWPLDKVSKYFAQRKQKAIAQTA